MWFFIGLGYNFYVFSVWERSLDSFGKVKTGDNKGCPFMYQGQYYDAEIELAYNRFRYYDPEEGRYISVDPIGLLSKEFNFYNYVGDPNVWLDPFGLARSQAGKAFLHKKIMNDDKMPKNIRGWFKHQHKKGVPFSKMTIPPGYDRAHFRGYESAKGYNYRYSELNLEYNHDLQHRHDGKGIKNREGVSKKSYKAK